MAKRKKAPTKGPKPGQEPVIRGDRVRALREKRGMTALQLCVAASIAPGQLSDVENGKRDLQCRGLRRLCLALEVSADFLLGLDDR